MEETNTMNIEPGKFYKTRGGNKVRIYATDGGPGRYVVHGAFMDSGEWHPDVWCIGGECYATDDTSESPKDIIAEWTDRPEADWSAMPRWANWVAMDEDEDWHWYENKPDRHSKYQEWFPADDGDCGGIHKDCTPANFTGDWKDSLIERPKE